MTADQIAAALSANGFQNAVLPPSEATRQQWVVRILSDRGWQYFRMPGDVADPVCRAERWATGNELGKQCSPTPILPTGWTVSAERFGAKGDGITDDYSALQAALDYVYDRGGGIVEIGPQNYRSSKTLKIWQRCYLHGVVAAFENQYSATLARPRGSCIYLADGANCDLISFEMRLYESGGVLYEVGTGRRIEGGYYRHHGGASKLTAWGNRSLIGSPPTAQDRNWMGSGLAVRGCHYIKLHEVIGMFCGDFGFDVGSFNYGIGVVSSNNIEMSKCIALSNVSNGFNLFGGDSTFHQLVAGFNGNDGIVSGMSSPLIGCNVWNNERYGIRYEGAHNMGGIPVSGNYVYDNKSNGIVINSGIASVTGNVSRGNGVNTTLPVTSRANYSMGAGAHSCAFAGNVSDAKTNTGVDVTYYGYYLNNSVHKVGLAGNIDRGCTVPLFTSNPANIIAAQSVS